MQAVEDREFSELDIRLHRADRHQDGVLRLLCGLKGFLGFQAQRRKQDKQREDRHSVRT